MSVASAQRGPAKRFGHWVPLVFVSTVFLLTCQTGRRRSRASCPSRHKYIHVQRKALLISEQGVQIRSLTKACPMSGASALGMAVGLRQCPTSLEHTEKSPAHF